MGRNMVNSSNDTGRLLVLTYHYIREKGGEYPGIHPMTPVDFSRQIQELKSNYHPVSPDEMMAFFNGRPLSQDSFLLSFDDGLMDHFSPCLDIMKEEGVKGVFFIPTRPHLDRLSPSVHKIHWLRSCTEPVEFARQLWGHLPKSWANFSLSKADQQRAAQMHIHDTPEVQALKFSLNFILPHDVVDMATSRMLEQRGVEEADFCDRTFMGPEQIQTLAAHGHIIGLHGHGHQPFSSYTPQRLDVDLQTNIQVLTDILGEPPRVMSYPYGRPDALPHDPAAVCQRHGIELGFTLMPGWNALGTDPVQIRRITPNELATVV